MLLHARAAPKGQRLLLILLAICSLTITAAAAAPQQQQQSGSEPIQVGIRIPTGGSRHMLQSAFCPDGCAPGQCQQDSTSGALRCAQCVQNLLVATVDGVSGLCTCPAGKYASGDSCVDCEKGFYCKGGKYAPATATAEAAPVRVSCPTNMTTLGKRRPSIFSCVNVPGTYYVAGATANDMSAATCPPDTYGPGLRKQRACVPCPTGFSTQGRMAQTTPSACVVPAGYYLKTPGQVAPCPAGEWKSDVGSSGNCTRCVMGVTTTGIASTSETECKVLAPGYYARELAADGAIKSVAMCPYGYFCPGGTPTLGYSMAALTALLGTEPTIKRCPSNAWTTDLGATSADACMTPPGYYTTPEGDTVPCPDGSWRSDWKVPAEATSCQSCGTGVLGSKTDRITGFNISTGLPISIAVQTSADDCYIQAGQGLYYETLTKTWRVKNCDANNYGVQNITYGLTPSPCRDCPEHLVASRAAGFSRSASFFTRNADGTGGFTSVMACVTTAGYGYSGRVAQKCDKGFWNTADNYDTCKPCPRGTTTSAPGAGKSAADCKVAPGFSGTGECPIGTYQDGLGINSSTPVTCTPCPTGRTTPTAGADSVNECNFCAAGWGGTNCSQPCGGTGLNATYGPAGRNILSPACLPCSDRGQTVTFSFNWNEGNDIFTPGVVSRIGAASPIECLAEYSQIVDSSYYIPLYSDLGVTTHENVASYAACVQLCTDAACQLVTYDYVSRQCFVRVSTAPVYEGMPWLALKVLPSGYIGTSPAAVEEISAKSLSTGMYTFYQEPDAEKVGDQVPAPGRSSFNSVGDCLKACDNEGVKCSGVTVLSTVEPLEIGRTCAFVRANINPGLFKRSMIRADLNRLLFPSSFLCPSGYTQDTTGATPCTPLTTPAVVYVILRAQQACSQDLIDSVRTALLNFLTDPNTAFGAYAPSVVVTVACYNVPDGQGGARRLLASNVANLVATIDYNGGIEAGKAIVTALAEPNNTALIVNATVLDAGVQPGTQQDAPASVVTLERLDTPPGDPYQFKTTYSTAGALDTADPSPVTLETLTEPDSMSCSVQQGGTGVALFTCRPLKALPAVTLTALAINRPRPSERVSASVTVLNTTCLKGSVPATGQTCQICDRGTYAPAQALTCTPCPGSGFTTAANAAFEVAQCDWCLAGRETSNCTMCPVGKYKAESGSAITAECTACSTLGAGFTTDGPGQTSCEVCLPGYYGPNCLPAPKGKWSAGGPKINATLVNCTTGFTTNATASASADNCTLCVGGYGGPTCQVCAKGTWSIEGPATSTTCQPCGTGKTTLGDTSVGVESCSRCVAGYGGSSCQVCAKGTWAAEETATIAACTPCGEGYTTPGNTSTSATNCSLCTAGRGGSSCNLCPIASWSPGDTTVCTNCSTGYTTFEDGSSSIDACYVAACGISGAQKTLLYEDFSTGAANWLDLETANPALHWYDQNAWGTVVQTTSFQYPPAPYRTNTGIGQVVLVNSETWGPQTQWQVVRSPATDPIFTDFLEAAPNGFITQIAIYLDVEGGFTNGQRLVYTIGFKSKAASFEQELVFNVGFYNDDVAPGSGPRFVGVASTQTDSTTPRDADKNPQVITTTSGWFNFQHKFYASNGNMVCALSVFPENCGTPAATWTLHIGASGSPFPATNAGYPGSGWLYKPLKSATRPNMAIAQQVFNTVL